MNRFFSLLAVSLLISMDVNANAIGELQVDSGIGQPFRAHVVIPAASPLNDDSFSIRMAPAYAYQNEDIPEEARLTDLSVRVENSDGNKIVHFITNEAVNKLFVQFIMDLHGDKQRWSQTFAAILDRPSGNFRQTALKRSTKKKITVKKAVEQKPVTSKQDKIKQESHSMEAEFGGAKKEESHSMEAEFGGAKKEESHSMEAEFGGAKKEESHSMEAEFGGADKKDESHSMEATVDQDS